MQVSKTATVFQSPQLMTAPLTQLVEGPRDAFTQAIHDVYLYPQSRPDQAVPLTQFRQTSSADDCKALQDLRYQSADGLVRTRNYYMAPKTLDLQAVHKGWEQSADGHPIADVVVIGAGPGGLATSYHLAQKGVRVVTLEAGYAAQAFSDGGAPAVHSMRTDRLLTSLVRTGKALDDLAISTGLPAGMAWIVPHARMARESLYQATGHRIQGVAHGEDRYTPAARGELFEHFQEVADRIATGTDNSMLIEQAPVSKVTRENGLFAVETSKGHKVYARKLVVSTGLVTSGGANAKGVPALQSLIERHPDRYLQLHHDGELISKNQDLHEVLTGQVSKTLIYSDRLLGSSEMQLAIRKLPANSRVAVVGSGESAVKAALEVLSHNPDTRVDLFMKSALEAAQVQVPSENFHPVVLEKAIHSPTYGKQSIERFKRHFDTPVTPRTMITMLDEQAGGRLEIYEMGAYFDEKSVSLEPDAQGKTRIQVIDPLVQKHLEDSRQSWKSQGLDRPLPADCRVDMFVTATGYERGKSIHTPLAEQLRQQNLMELDGNGQPRYEGLVSSSCANLAFNSSGALQTAADSSIPGLAVRGRNLAEFLAAQLPQRPLPPQPALAERPGADWVNDYDQKDFEGFVRYRGLAPNWVEGNDFSTPEDRNQRNFPDPERFLRDLANRKDQLGLSERITLRSGLKLVERIGDPASPL